MLLTMTASPLKILTPEQLAFYQANEYLLLRNVISPSILDKAERAIQRWVNSLIEDWVREGKLQNTYAELPFQTRLIEAWNAAGKPVYNPNPTLELVSREIYDILREPLFTQIAQDLFDSPDVSASGVFHCRPNLPEQPLTDTPWHQDAQCCPTLAGTKFVVMWIPLVDVDETNACLEGAIGKQHQGKLYRNYKDPHGYYISMRPDDVSRLTNKSKMSLLEI